MKIFNSNRITKRVLQGTAVCLVVGAAGAGRSPDVSTPTDRQWEQRAYRSADNLQKARHLINLAIFALEIRPVTKGFEQALAEKPHDFIRRVNFIHAASEVVSATFPVRENIEKWPEVTSDKPVYAKAVALISKYAIKVTNYPGDVGYWHVQHSIASPDLIVSAQNLVPGSEFTPSTGVQEGKIALRDAKRATALDPNFAEAWYIRGQTASEVRDRHNTMSPSYQAMWIKAGKLDHAFAPYIYYERAMTEFNNPKQQHKDLAEYIKLFPNDPWRNILCNIMKCPDLKKLPVTPQMPDVADYN